MDAPGHIGGEAQGPEAVERVKGRDVRVGGRAGEDEQLFYSVLIGNVCLYGGVSMNVWYICYIYMQQKHASKRAGWLADAPAAAPPSTR